MTMNPPWKAAPASRRAPKPPPKNSSTHIDEADAPPTSTGPCDGDEAGRLLRLYGLAAVPAICQRVALFGGRPRKPVVDMPAG